MARKRMIKPDFWKSPKLGQLDHFSRLLFIGLWQVADDHGNGPMEPPLIAAELFPFDLANPTHDILSECSRGTHALAEQGLIRVYEASGRDFYHLPGFKEHQTINRPSNPQYPSPDQGVYKDSLSTHDTLNEPSRNTQPEPNRREPNKNSSLAPNEDDTDRFEDWWKHYPKKVDKGDARKAYTNALTKTTHQTLVDGAQGYAHFCENTNRERQYMKGPARWLNVEGWANEDELDTPKQHKPSKWDLPPEAYMHPEEVEDERRRAEQQQRNSGAR